MGLFGLWVYFESRASVYLLHWMLDVRGKEAKNNSKVLPKISGRMELSFTGMQEECVLG